VFAGCGPASEGRGVSSRREPVSAVYVNMVRPRIGGEVEAIVGEAEIADDGVMEVLDAGDVLADVVGGQASAELVALGGELAD
jgi:hypothetical protein